MIFAVRRTRRLESADEDRRAREVEAAGGRQAASNVVVHGPVARDGDAAETASSFVRKHGLDFPILLDPGGARSRASSALPPGKAASAGSLQTVGDYLIFGFCGIDTSSRVEPANYDNALRKTLHLRIEPSRQRRSGSLGRAARRRQTSTVTRPRFDAARTEPQSTWRARSSVVDVLPAHLPSLPRRACASWPTRTEATSINSDDLVIVPDQRAEPSPASRARA